MKVLIIGSGAREYSIAKRLKEDSISIELYFCPGNGATNKLGKNIDIKDFNDLADFALKNNVDLTIVGPELPLSQGVVDIFKEKNLAIFGPTKNAARLESSKSYMKDFLKQNNILTAKYLNTNNIDEAYKFIDTFENKTNIVIKTDGLCAGKGVVIATSKEEAKKVAKDLLSGESFGNAGNSIVIEEFLDGFELSFFAICDGEIFVSLPVAQDHKRLKDGDIGLNTGEMGAYAPSSLACDELISKIKKDIVTPTLQGIKKVGDPFCGVLFVGIMVVDSKPYVLEFNFRFGDPECEVLMPLIKNDLSQILLSAANGKLTEIEIKDECAVGVAMASKNYPYSSSNLEEIIVKENNLNAHISYGGVSFGEDLRLKKGALYSNSGRVLVCVGLGKDIKEAKDNAYKLCENVTFKGVMYRKDIAYQALRDNDKLNKSRIDG